MLEQNVLVVSYYFPPMGLSGVQRTLKFVKYLPNNGWKPTVLTTNSNSYYAFDETLMAEIPDLNIIRTAKDTIFSKVLNPKNNQQKTLKYPNYLLQKISRVVTQSIFQPDSKITWKKHALDLGREELSSGKYNVIFATAPPFTDFLVAQKLAEEFNLPFVLDYRDLWVDNAYYYYLTTFHKNYAIKLEYEALKKAAKIIVTSRNLKETLLKRYNFLSPNDVVIIPHGYDAEDFADVRGISKAKEKFVLTHSGLFPDDLTPKYFLKAVKELLKEKPDLRSKIELKFVGLMRNSHLKLISSYKLNDITTITGYVSHKESIREILSSDALWIMIPNNIVTPSRLYEYIGSRKPFIMMAPSGDMKQTAIDSKVAITTDVKDITAIKNAILDYYTKWENNTLPQTSVDFIKKYDRKYLTEILARELAYAGRFF